MTVATTLKGEPAWPADWSQFIPDLVSSALIGLAVGVSLYLWQKGSERRQAEAFALASWRTARSRVAVSVAPEAFPSAPADPRDGGPFRAFRRAIDGLPLAEWASASPRNVELRLLSTLAESLPFFEEAGSELVKEVSVELIAADGAYLFPSDDKKYVIDATLRELGPSGSFGSSLTGIVMGALVGESAVRKYEDLDAKARTVSQSGRVRAAHARYAESYKRVRDLYNELRASLRPAVTSKVVEPAAPE
ncbi:hypothetical protein J7E29_11525 [Streptomyces sp. ISL-90]|nr:hypothetical protein [Streptomyces sp. ISL-90]